MRICILEHPRIRPHERFNDIANTPLWSCLMGGYAAAILQEAGHEVTFWDTTKTRWDFAKTKEQLLDLAPDLLCINAVYLWEHTATLFEFIKSIKTKGFTGHSNLFGFFPTLAWRSILEKTDGVDSIAVGEYEYTLVQLAKRLSEKKELSGILGLSLSSIKDPQLLVKRTLESDPDKFPFPLRDSGPNTTVSILASRGCYNHCRFCPVPSFYNDGPLWQGRSPEKVFEEMALLVEQGYRDFYFVDPNFIGPGKNGKKRALQLLDLIRPLNITFGMETRPNDLDQEIMDSLVSSGFNSLLLGIESGSNSVLGSLDKYSSQTICERAIALCRSVGIEPEIGFLMFVPDSTVEDLNENLQFLLKNNLLDRLGRTVNLLSHCQIVLMGTSGYSRFAEQGRLTPTGMLGFEGLVTYHDKTVELIAEIVVHECHFVLREMERKESPLYWKIKETTNTHARINTFLVNMFETLLLDTQKSCSLAAAEGIKRKLTTDMQDIINGA